MSAKESSSSARSLRPRMEVDTPLPPVPKLMVPVIVGTRPEAIKLAPVIMALNSSASFYPIVVSTGQHHKMVQEIFELAGIGTGVTLWAGSGMGLNERVASIMQRFEDFIHEWFGSTPERLEPEHLLTGRYPAAVFVHGDTSSAMASALAAFHLRIPVIHVEAGLRTGGLNLTPFPEELNRQVISRVACLHLAPTARNMEQLIRERISVDQILVTGNTGVDALEWASQLNTSMCNSALQAVMDSDRRLVVVTAHRRENWIDGLEGIAQGISRLATMHPEVQFIVPLHPNPLVEKRLGDPLVGIENVLVTGHMSYAPFAKLLARSCLVITDSGGIQEEAPALGKPVLVTRDETERVEGLEAGTLKLVGTNPDRIVDAAHTMLTDPNIAGRMAAIPNPYGDGRAAQRILAAMEYTLGTGEPPVPFSSGFNRGAVIRAGGFNDIGDDLETVMARAMERERESQKGIVLDESWFA